ncbi:tRNA (N6-isopentenyl adenosine(37)-C2)-methylthiotransferase MiaB [Gelria sp. Kuro-4]|uniref:tRNA (N6-isopentenyl adenosine(37)-C2)-methylthiotransferase MiaB n=1 Tax=Gelria sp. Kuro-4 TaxID=2796927 RepID=UPI001BEE8BD9|nr:tRNA (N6-isopentenyl adenosine(37)-C2)-methylthiotransferase MiaB [Gelria sp. Kuro-4]BCV25033.1 tRNA-2-methylthio-N(6)-dimethylallyladenosine synthase [Gelria sp. Kuro-4]
MARGKFLLKVAGCQMSFHDAEVLAGLLKQAGYTEAAAPAEADVIVFQTCCVRETAERKLYGQVNELRGLKREKPGLIVGLAGCLAQKDREKALQRCPHLDFVLGTQRLGDLPQILAALRDGCQGIVDVDEGANLEGLPIARAEGVRAYVNISYGCNNFCTYCIVPYVRGPEKSRPPAAVLAEVEEAAQAGYREVMLLGQNVNTYGRDLEEPTDFAALLRRVDKVPQLARIRYMTSHPRDFTEEMIRAVRETEKVCEHFHLPLQAGSNRILAAMNRGYTRERYLKLVAKVRSLVPGASITTDLIVGFPGETEEDFQATLDMVERVRFDAAYTFIFSPREGTRAATLPGQVTAAVKKERLARLNALQNRISRELNEALVGRVVEILVEGPSKNNPDRLAGRTRTNKLVHFTGPASLRGEQVKVRIKRAFTWTLDGDLVTPPN